MDPTTFNAPGHTAYVGEPTAEEIIEEAHVLVTRSWWEGFCWGGSIVALLGAAFVVGMIP
jgi:dienelactone hydrolase